jgi:hypothetical protein
MNRTIQSILDRRAPKMDVHYMSVGEAPAIMTLDELIANFDENNGWYRSSAEHMREALNDCGWYYGVHNHGHYLVINISKTELQPKAYWR